MYKNYRYIYLQQNDMNVHLKSFVEWSIERYSIKGLLRHALIHKRIVEAKYLGKHIFFLFSPDLHRTCTGLVSD